MTEAVKMFLPAQEACLTQAELANLAGVSRITANNWWNGKGKPHRLHGTKIIKLMTRIAELIESNDLPLRGTVKGTARAVKLHELVYGDVSE